MECLICLRDYDSQEVIPKVLSCGHCICNPCLLDLKMLQGNIKCSICNKIDPRKLENIPKNYLFLEQIQKIDHLATEMIQKDVKIEEQKEIIDEYHKIIEDQNQRINELNNEKNMIMQGSKVNQYLIFDEIANEGLDSDYILFSNNISLCRRLFCKCSINCSEICKKNSILFKFFCYYCIVFLPFVSI